MRGKLSHNCSVVCFVRIIPAHAGQTNRPRGIRGQGSDHPRACGANPCLVRVCAFCCGSSPRMRGKRMHMDMSSVAARIIPAHAGQTTSLFSSRKRVTDHPRACGANPRMLNVPHTPSGSSPRMRGKPMVQRIAVKHIRIIPAHAGQTPTGTCSAKPATDHPRACGANPVSEVKARWSVGSSPRMRGKHACLTGCPRPFRIIPAHAGQTVRCGSARCVVTDHPRACGANNGYVSGYGPLDGSSPRMRGKQI